MNLERYFDPVRGLLRTCISEWEPRPQQQLMADAVGRCLMEGGACAVEASTGTGKTFAYLVPALLVPGRVVVATGTRNLQDQIFLKDLPLLQRVEGLTGKAVLVKGLGNYICKRRLQRLRERASAPGLIDDPHLASLVAWAASTRTGDISELEGVPEGYASKMDVVSGAGMRLGGSCPFFGECHVTRLRRQAEQAKLIVTNHHLFFADLALREVAEGVLPDYDAVIFDEAHRLDDVATEFFGHRSSMAEIGAALGEGSRIVRGRDSPGGTRGRSRGGRDAALRAAERSARAFFESLGRRLAPVLLGRKGPGFRLEEDGALLRGALLEPFLDGTLTRQYHELDDLLDRAALSVASTPEGGEAASLAGRRILDARQQLATVLDMELPGYVFWAEVHASDAARTRLGASPIDLAPLFRERVFERTGSVVLTSATLSPDGSMSHLARTIGYPVEDAESLVLPTPFDVESSSILYIPRDAPLPSHPDAGPHVAGEIARLVRLTGGGALVLFSSWKAMRFCHALCAPELAGFELLIQGQAPRHELLLRLRGGDDGVLFATSSFREGVDVPGRALRLVVVDKIPFDVPDEPVLEARIRRIRESGGDPFNELQLPSAALTLKQGLGRLLRTHSDRGILAVLDPRIWTRGYGRRILAALPACPVTDDFEDVARFWRHIEG